MEMTQYLLNKAYSIVTIDTEYKCRKKIEIWSEFTSLDKKQVPVIF